MPWFALWALLLHQSIAFVFCLFGNTSWLELNRTHKCGFTEVLLIHVLIRQKNYSALSAPLKEDGEEALQHKPIWYGISDSLHFMYCRGKCTQVKHCIQQSCTHQRYTEQNSTSCVKTIMKWFKMMLWEMGLPLLEDKYANFLVFFNFWASFLGFKFKLHTLGEKYIYIERIVLSTTTSTTNTVHTIIYDQWTWNALAWLCPPPGCMIILKTSGLFTWYHHLVAWHIVLLRAIACLCRVLNNGCSRLGSPCVGHGQRLHDLHTLSSWAGKLDGTSLSEGNWGEQTHRSNRLWMYECMHILTQLTWVCTSTVMTYWSCK